MTAPDMVSIIAAVLRVHLSAFTTGHYRKGGRWQAHCACGHVSKFKGDPDLDDKAHAAHQARAVLAALESAGQVEWGWEYRGLIGGKYDRRITRNWTADRALTQEEAQSEVDNMNYRHPNIARLIHRTATAWMAVEG